MFNRKLKERITTLENELHRMKLERWRSLPSGGDVGDVPMKRSKQFGDVKWASLEDTIKSILEKKRKRRKQ